MNINFEFRNIEQKKFFYSTARNSCFSGGFGNGKTFSGCQRQFLMQITYPGYVSLFARQTYKDLRSTTQKTYFKICPPSFIERHSDQEGITVLKNGSVCMWLHLDAFDEKSLRGLEINSALIDQVEEIEEAIYLVLDFRVGRWDKAMVPQKLKDAFFQRTGKRWPCNDYGGDRVPNFMDILCNPESEFSWIYKRYHPLSIERKNNHFYIERATDESLNDPLTIVNAKDRDEEWVNKYYYGKWGVSSSQIHRILPDSILSPDLDFIKNLLNKAALFRVLDHGESAPTCCLFVTAINNIHVIFAEYYIANEVISTHRRNINDLTNYFISLTNSRKFEEFSDYADPAIFKQTLQKYGGFWSVAKEYSDDDIDAPPVFWAPADNNEFATRNRINELLRISQKFVHPITKISPAPALYFIKFDANLWPYGCKNTIIQVQSQRREVLSSENGRTIYSDARNKNVTDHAYDCVRYYVAQHNSSLIEPVRVPPKRSFTSMLKSTKFYKEITQ